MTNPICTYDFTLSEIVDRKEDQPTSGRKITFEEIRSWLERVAKKWCFQLEKGTESGWQHFQGRLSLKTKKRQSTLIGEMPWKEMHISPTSTENRDNMFYVTKEETRIAGPWADTDEKIYIPRQVKEVMEHWRPWQAMVINEIQNKVWDTRTIHVFYDPEGHTGKSVLVSYLGATKQACQIPFCNDYKDILRAVMDRPKRGAYLIDMPRAINKEKLNQLYSGIETVKSGYAYDDRYSFQEEYFDCPQMYVFTNKVPDISLLSRDRWKIWMITRPDYGLTPYVLPTLDVSLVIDKSETKINTNSSAAQKTQ